KIIVLERNSLKQGFGFRIRGGNSREPSITVAEVKQGSIADQQGLNYRDKIVSVNEKRCGKNGMNMNELIRKIKASKVLQIRITPVQNFCEDVRRAEDVGEANGRERRKQQDELLSTVTVYPGEDGWLGCCIRGGTDYACDVHVISVDTRSPAERAGIKPGDMIVKINGLSTKDLTHVQVVRLVITSGLSVQFSLMCGRKQRSSGQQATNVQPTPLRTYCTRPHEATPPQSPSIEQFRPPGYPHGSHGVAESPSQLPLHVLTLDCLPPPPYTPEVPSRHRVLARGKVEPGVPVGCREELQHTHCNQEVQDTIFQEEESSSIGQQQQPQGTHSSQDSQHASNRDEGKPERQQLQSSSSVQKPVVTMEIIDCEDINTDDADMFQDVGQMGEHDSHSSIVQQRNKPETVIEETQDNTSPSSSSQSTASSNGRFIQQFNQANLRSLGDSTNLFPPPQENSRESFLSQIRQFNKEKLRKLSGFPGQTIPCQLQGNPSANEGLPEDILQSVESEKDSMQVNDVQECVDADSLFAALAQVMHSRAKVLQDTLSSIEEYDSDSSDGEWEL
ncbi:unnamed protein product, partial [Porites evermanni]